MMLVQRGRSGVMGYLRPIEMPDTSGCRAVAPTRISIAYDQSMSVSRSRSRQTSSTARKMGDRGVLAGDDAASDESAPDSEN
jgi:hypothetical protein